MSLRCREEDPHLGCHHHRKKVVSDPCEPTVHIPTDWLQTLAPYHKHLTKVFNEFKVSLPFRKPPKVNTGAKI